jgi:hypothetical protein
MASLVMAINGDTAEARQRRQQCEDERLSDGDLKGFEDVLDLF